MYRKELIKYGKMLVKDGLTSGTGGNLSFYDRDSGIIWITPSGLAYEDLLDDDIVGINLQGNTIMGSLKPSSEWHLHVEVYKNRDDVNAIIHGHTVYSTVMSILREPLVPSHYMIALAGKKLMLLNMQALEQKSWPLMLLRH